MSRRCNGQISWAGAFGCPRIVGVIQMAGLKAKTATPNTPIQLVPQVLQGSDAGVDVAAKTGGNAGPIFLGRGLVRRQRLSLIHI